jgi:hypothetical protein
MTTIIRQIFFFMLSTAVLTSCAKSPKKNPKYPNMGDGDSTHHGDDHGNQGDDGDPNKSGDDGKPLMLTCDVTANKKYPGLGKKELTIGRLEEVPSLGDRARIKPYSALTGEFVRVLNGTPNSLTANAATFNAPGDRWYVEPALNGVNVFTAYRAAYEAALTYVNSNAMLATAPTDESAREACAMIAEKAWNRTPSDQEIDACKKVAMTDTSSVGDTRKRWAYAIAAVLVATGFMSY